MYLDTGYREITFLGFILNSTTMMVYLSDKKKEKLKFLCTQALDGDILIRFVAGVIGKTVSSLPGSDFGKLHYRNLERDFTVIAGKLVLELTSLAPFSKNRFSLGLEPKWHLS